MPDLLLELFSEEIPARMQARAAEDLKRLVTDALVERGLSYEGARALATPRRLMLHVAGLPVQGRDVREEKKGPRVGAPEQAVLGFLKSAGLASLDQATIEHDPKKGDFYVAILEKPGRATLDVLAEVIPAAIRAFPWPKSMRWGAASAQPGALRWVRPLQSILAIFGNAGEEPESVPFDVDGIRAGDVTFGHRFHAPGPIRVKRFDDYVAKLEAAKVVIDPARRKEIIRTDARNLAFAQGLEVIEDDALLDEVSGLVEWPVVLMGNFDPSFLDVPAEAIRTTIRANQKCFVLKDAHTGRLAPKFLLTANIAASDGGALIVAGNEKVIRARLSDARFFWETDRRVPLEDRLPKLDSVTFHARLGSQGDRVRRIVALAKELAPQVGADPAMAGRAALLAKADLSTEMVGEFPELQGFMGRTYAALQGETEAVAAAIEDHYKPLGPGDRTPSEPVSVAVALADKLDILTGFWSIDEKPTGSKDPYALRRAALGVIRLILDNGLRLPLAQVASLWLVRGVMQMHRASAEQKDAALLEKLQAVPAPVLQRELAAIVAQKQGARPEYFASLESAVKAANAQSLDLMTFFADRLKVQLREAGARHDLVDAVLSLPGQDDLLMVARRVEALGAFLDSEDGKNLLAGYRRAANILRAEEKKDGAGAFEGAVEAGLLAIPAEAGLFAALRSRGDSIALCLGKEQFREAMQDMASLRPAVDAFFEAVMVNAEDPALRLNRLRLLTYLRAIMHQIADFSKIGG